MIAIPIHVVPRPVVGVVIGQTLYHALKPASNVGAVALVGTLARQVIRGVVVNGHWISSTRSMFDVQHPPRKPVL